MEPISLAFIISAFIAGIVTFLAPCTLPLVPGYLSFISGASITDLQDPSKAKKARGKIFLNGVFYVLGFSAVFILFFGVLLGIAGTVFGQYSTLLTKIGGAIVIFFGFFLIAQAVTALSNGRINLLRLPFLGFLNNEHKVTFARKLKPGNPISSFALGASFAAGWSPCVGPVLGLILGLATTTSTIGQSILLLAVFSLGLGIPFLLTALAIGWASRYFVRIAKYLYWVSLFGGAILIVFGYMMISGNFVILNSIIFEFFERFGLEGYEEALLDFL